MNKCLPDKKYDPKLMEMDGDYNKILQQNWDRPIWTKFKRRMHDFDGSGPWSKNFASFCFNDPLEACAVTGGLGTDLIWNWTFNSNQYVEGKLFPSRHFYRMLWKNISVTEMYRFLGILMKMYLLTGNEKGYKSLWYPSKHVNVSATCQIKVNDYTWWVGNYK